MSTISKRFAAFPAGVWNDLNGTQMRVLGEILLIKPHMSGPFEGWCQINQKTLAERLGLARETINRAIAAMRKLGWLLTKDTRRAGKPGGISFYQIVYDRAAAVNPSQGLVSQEASQHNKPKNNNYTGAPPSSELLSKPNGNLQKMQIAQSEGSSGEPYDMKRQDFGDDELQGLYESLLGATGDALHPSLALQPLSLPLKWLGRGLNLKADILPLIRHRARRKETASIRSWAYFSDAFEDLQSRQSRQKRKKRIINKDSDDLDWLRAFQAEYQAQEGIC